MFSFKDYPQTLFFAEAYSEGWPVCYILYSDIALGHSMTHLAPLSSSCTFSLCSADSLDPLYSFFGVVLRCLAGSTDWMVAAMALPDARCLFQERRSCPWDPSEELIAPLWSDIQPYNTIQTYNVCWRRVTLFSPSLLPPNPVEGWNLATSALDEDSFPSITMEMAAC